MSELPSFTLTVEHREGMSFVVKFDWDGVPELLLDEPAPLGAQQGPNAVRLVAAAVANCLSASLLFCLQKSKVGGAEIGATAHGRVARNEQGRLRIEGIDVQIQLAGVSADAPRLPRCLELFEDFCVVTESVRKGIPVTVTVTDTTGTPLLPPAAD